MQNLNRFAGKKLRTGVSMRPVKNFVYGTDEGFRPISNIIALHHLSIPSVFNSSGVRS